MAAAPRRAIQGSELFGASKAPSTPSNFAWRYCDNCDIQRQAVKREHLDFGVLADGVNRLRWSYLTSTWLCSIHQDRLVEFVNPFKRATHGTAVLHLRLGDVLVSKQVFRLSGSETREDHLFAIASDWVLDRFNQRVQSLPLITKTSTVANARLGLLAGTLGTTRFLATRTPP